MTTATKQVIDSIAKLNLEEQKKVLHYLVELTQNNSILPENWEQSCIESKKEADEGRT